MDALAPFMLFLIGLLYIIAFGALSLMRREGLSIRFAVESLLVTGIVGGLAIAAGFAIHPVVFLIVLYLITMRARLLVDLGNAFAGQGRFRMAGRIYDLAGRLGADPASRANIAVNRGVARLQQGQVEEAIAIFLEILTRRGTTSLGIKNEAACQYNLGVAYGRCGQRQEAARAFQAVLDVWPVSEYGRRASIALKKQKSGSEK